MIKLDAVINDKKLLSSIQKGVDIFNKSTSGKSKLNLKINEKGFRQPLGRITGDLDKFESALAASNARVIAFGASTAVIGGMTKAFKELALTTINVQKSFADINRILNVSNREFESFSTQLFNIGKRTATTFEDSSKAALEFARQGLGLNETLKRTADALTLVRLTGVNADKAVSSLTAAVNAFQHTSITTTEVLNKFVAVETKFAVSARDLMEGLGRVGSAAVDAKVNFNELNAMVAAVQQQTGRGGAVIGNALKTIFTRLQRRDTLTALESYGIAVRNIEGQTRPAMAILQDFAKTYDKLADSNKAYLREQVAGVFQANILSAIVKDLNSNTQVYNRAMVVSTNATNESEMANARLNKTLSALISQTGTELIRLQENLGKITFEPIAKGLLAPFKGVVEGLNNLIDGEGLGSEIANGLLKGIRNVLAGPGLIGAFAVIGSTIIKTVGYMAKALPTLVGITSQTQKRANLEATISAMLATDAGLVRQIAASEGNAATQAGILLAASQKTETAFAAAAISTAAIARNLAKAGMVASKAGAIVPRGRGATGFIPGMAGELSDIRRGTGGVSSSARPVHLPNFAFAGGDRGSMIANTGEYTVPNYRGGGSAIFNPDMVRANGGLPKGAKKITASKGYVPNFAIKPTTALGAGTTLDALTRGIISGQYSAINVGRSYDVGGKTYSAATINEKILAARVSRDAKVKGKKDKKGAKNVFSIPAGELAGGIGAIVGFGTRTPAGIATSKTGFAQLIAGKKSPNPQLAAYLQKNATGKNAKHIQLTGIPVAALNKLGGTGDAKAKKSIETRFRKTLNKFMLPALNRYTSTIFKDLLKDDGLTFVKELLENKRNVFSTSVEGGIFESALRLAGRKSKSFKGDDMARFDFEESGTISPALADTFFKGKKVTRADAKRSDTAPNIKTLISKAVGTPATANSMWQALLNRGASPVADKAAQGYVPNFAGRGATAARVRQGTRGARGAAQLKIPTQSGLTVLVKGIDYKIIGGKARFTAIGEQKAFGAGGLENGGTSLTLADGRMVLSNKPLHGMAAMQAGIPASKIESLVVGGGFHNVNTGRLTFRESDFVQSNRLQQVVGGAGGYVPNFQRTSLAQRLAGSSKAAGAKLFGKSGIPQAWGAGKNAIGKAHNASLSISARGGNNSIAQALNYLVRSLTVGLGKGLPLSAFIADAIAKYGLIVTRQVVKIMKNIWKGDPALKNIKWKQKSFGTTDFPTFARGYVPNFGGLGAALGREKAAGIPSSAIRISSSPRFQNAQNPAGLAVHNTLDEPRGLADVPNFAFFGGSEPLSGKGGWGTLSTTGVPGNIPRGARRHTSVLPKAEKELEKELKKALKSYKKGKISRDKLNQTRDKLIDSMNLTKRAQDRVKASLNKQRAAIDAARPAAGGKGGGGAIVGGPGGRGAVGGAGGGMGGIMAMMMVPMVGGMAEQAIGGQGGAAISGGATGGMMGGLLGGMTGAAMATGTGFMAPTIMGAKVGGVGGPAGAAVGAAIGITIGAIIAWNSAAESATDKLQAFTAELNASLSGANAYAAGRKAMDEATTMNQFEAAAHAASDALMTIDDPALRKAMIENKNEFESLTTVIREYKEEEMKRILLQKGIATLTDKMPKEDLFASQAYQTAAGITEGFAKFQHPGKWVKNPNDPGGARIFQQEDPETKGGNRETEEKIRRSIEERSFNQLFNYFKKMGTTLPEMEEIQKALSSGEHGYLGKLTGGGQISQERIFKNLQALRRTDELGQTTPLLQEDVSRALADMMAGLDPGGMVTGAFETKEAFNKAMLLQSIKENLATLYSGVLAKSKEEVDEIARRKEQKFIFIEQFKKIVAEVDQAIIDSARITRDVAFQVTRRTTRTKARSQLLGKGRSTFAGQREAFDVSAGNLALRRADMANPIIGAQSRGLSALIAEINQKGGQGGIALQDLKRDMMDPMRAGNIMQVVEALRATLAKDPKQLGGIAEQAVRTRAENMARNLEAAWGKGGELLDQQEKALLDEHRINIVREEILKAERDIQHQKNEYLSGLKIQQVKEEVRLKKQLSALTMQGKDPRGTRGMSLLEQQSFRSNLERQKIVAQRDSTKKQLDLDFRAKKAEIEATFLLNKSTLTLVQSNAELFTAIESLTKAVGGTPVGAGAGGGTPEGRKKLKGQITDLGHLIQRDGAYSSEQVAEQEQRQKQLKGLKKKLADYEIGGEPAGLLPQESRYIGGEPVGLLGPMPAAGGIPPIALPPTPTPGFIGGEPTRLLQLRVGAPGGLRPEVFNKETNRWEIDPQGGRVPVSESPETLSPVLINTESMAKRRQKIEESIVGYQKEGLNFSKNNKSEAEGLTDELEERIRKFKILQKEQKKARRIRAKGGLKIFDEEAAQDVKLLGRTVTPGAFAEGWGGGMQRVKEDSETIFHLLGERLPVQLRDGLVTAMEAGLDGATSIGDAMRTMAVDVLKMIRRAFLQRMVSNVVGALPMGPTDTVQWQTGHPDHQIGGVVSQQIGGLIRAQGGLSVPGSGSGDKIPIMAEPNEYVLNKNAVAALGGERALDNLNFNVAPRFGGRMALNEDPLSSKMSGLYYATGSPELDELLQKMREKEEKRKAKKAEKRALWTSFATMLATAAVFKGMDVASDKWGDRHSELASGTFGPDKPLSSSQRKMARRGAKGKFPKGHSNPDWDVYQPVQWQTGHPDHQIGGVVRRYGLGSGYQAGGSVRGLSAPSSNTNNISINISTGSNNERGENATAQQGGQDINSDNGSSSKEFARRISDAVKRVIVEEQRVSGSLSPGGRRR